MPPRALPLDREKDRILPGLSDPGLESIDDDDDDDLDIKENPDGSATVSNVIPIGRARKGNANFSENLAETLEESEMLSIATDLLDKIGYDKTAREERDKQYAEGLKRTGLGGEAPGGATFAGASKAVHPMLAEACVDFAASAIKEMFPPAGPVKTDIPGEQDEETLALADRQYKYMNWQLKDQITEYYEELEQLLTQLPMGGSQYMKFWYDESLGRVACEFVPIDDIYLPYACNDFWTAHRRTHVQRLTRSVMEDRIDSGLYRDVDLLGGIADTETPDQTAASKATEKIQGAEPSGVNIDEVRLIYEVSVDLRLSCDGDKRLPYLISICERTHKVVALYRNWDETDARQKRLHWIADFGFIPWRGAYKVGLPHLIGGLSAAATGALRALLDSALIATLPVLVKLKAAKTGGQSKTLDPTQAIEIEGGTAIDDIRKIMMPMPFPGPSPVLYELLGWLTNAAKGVVTTAEEKISEASNDMPVGTALALIEQGAKVFSSIHARLHRSQKRAFSIIARLNGIHLTVEDQEAELGEVLALPEDFRKPLKAIPVSDPNVFSEGQRYAQMHLVQYFAAQYPQLHDLYQVVKSSYKLAKIADVDKILPEPKKPQEQNAVAENSAVMLGQPILAFPEQDHFAHLETHTRFVQDPLMGGNPAAVPAAWPKMLEHIKQHLSFAYAQTMYEQVNKAIGGDIGSMMRDRKNLQKVDQVLAAASRAVHDLLMNKLKPLGPVINAMMQQVAKMQTPPPMDPSQAALQIADKENQTKLQTTQLAEKTKQAKIDADAAKTAADIAAKQQANLIAEKKIDLDHGLSEDAQMHDQVMDLLNHLQTAASAQIDADAAQQEQEQAQQDQAHRQAMDVAGHHQAQAAQDHSQNMDQENLARGDQDRMHSQAMDIHGAASNLNQQRHGQFMDATGRQFERQQHDDSQSMENKKLQAAKESSRLAAKSKSANGGSNGKKQRPKG